MDEVIHELWSRNGSEVSELSHKEYGWLLTDDQETIPYASAFFSPDPLTVEQEELGRQVATRNGLIVRTPPAHRQENEKQREMNHEPKEV